MLQDLINNLAGFIREHSWTACIAWTASLLVIYGVDLVRLTKKIARSWYFVFRVLFFVVVCGFGYGFLTLSLARFIHSQMVTLNNLWLCISVILAYLLIGFLAEKNRVL
ncbi:MAG: DUF3392 family protein [Rubritalea sp.]|jgi:hypothetical protein|tara:strand:- start:157 stop:483 length:327 start_codon:yes stop_codon:yes gene_type:complete